MSVAKKRSCFLWALLILFFCFCGPLQLRADAVALIDDAAVLIAAALGAWGVNMTVTGSWGTVEAYVTSKMAEYCTSIGSTVTDWLSSWSISMSRNGSLIANVAGAAAIAAFARWLVTDLGLVNSSTQLVYQQSGYFFDDGSPLVLAVHRPAGGFQSLGTIFQIGTNYRINSHLYSVSYDSTASRYQLYKDGVVFYSFGTSVSSFNYYMYSQSTSSVTNGTAVDTLTVAFYRSLSEDMTNTSSSYLSNVTYGQLFGNTSNDQLALTTGTIAVPTDTDLTDAGLVIGADIPAGTSLSNAIPIIQAGIVAGTLNPTATITAADSLPETLPNYGSAGDYQVGLSELFPFCVPFDLYNFFSVLAADPVAPDFELPFVIDGLVDYTFEIDLSPFSSVAQIVRTMELLLFIVGLILLTRRIIRG